MRGSTTVDSSLVRRSAPLIERSLTAKLEPELPARGETGLLTARRCGLGGCSVSGAGQQICRQGACLMQNLQFHMFTLKILRGCQSTGLHDLSNSRSHERSSSASGTAGSLV